MVITKTTYEYRLQHPVNGTYIAVSLFDEKAYKDWGPYLDVVEKWFLNKALDVAYDKLLEK